MPKASNKAEHTIKNATLAILLQFVVILSGFFVKRLVMLNYGQAIDGVIVTVNNISNYLNLVAAGLGMASIQALYAPLAKNDWDEVNGVMSASNHFYNQTGTLFTLLAAVVAVGYSVLMRDTVDPWLVAGIVLIMGLSGSIEYYLYDKYRVFLTADQKLYIVTMVTICGTILQTVLKIVLVYAGVHILLVQLLPAVIYFLRVLVLMWYVKRNYPQLNRRVPPNKKALGKRWSVFVHQIAGLVVNNTDVVLLTVVTRDPNLISVYGVYNYVFSNLYVLMSNSFSQGSMASFGQMIANDDPEKVRRGYGHYEFVYYMVVAVIYSIAAVMILPFVTLYTKGVKEKVGFVDLWIGLMFVVISLSNNLRVPGLTIINAKGHFKETQNRAIIEAGINLVVSAALVWHFGIYGVLFGTIVSFLYRTIDIILYSNRVVLKQKVGRTLRRGGLCIGIIVLHALVFQPLMMRYATGWLKWMAGCLLVGGASLAVTFVINWLLEKSTMDSVRQLILQTIKKKMTRKHVAS